MMTRVLVDLNCREVMKQNCRKKVKYNLNKDLPYEIFKLYRTEGSETKQTGIIKLKIKIIK
jgi:hypothetical protein